MLEAMLAPWPYPLGSFLGMDSHVSVGGPPLLCVLGLVGLGLLCALLWCRGGVPSGCASIITKALVGPRCGWMSGSAVGGFSFWCLLALCSLSRKHTKVHPQQPYAAGILKGGWSNRTWIR